MQMVSVKLLYIVDVFSSIVIVLKCELNFLFWGLSYSIWFIQTKRKCKLGANE